MTVRSYNCWSKQELELLHLYWPNSHRTHVVELIPNHTYASINTKAHKLGLRKNTTYPCLWKGQPGRIIFPKQPNYTVGRNVQLKSSFSFSETEAAYLAGVLDGDGTISIRKTPTPYSKLGFTITKTVGIYNTNLLLMEWIANKTGVHLNKKPRTRTVTEKPVYEAIFSGYDSITAFLQPLLPYLVAKRERAELMLLFCKSRITTLTAGHGTNGGNYTQDELALADTIKSLTRRFGHPDKSTYEFGGG